MNKNRKKVILTAILALALTMSATAQIFITEEEQALRSGVETENGIIPANGSLSDQANEEYLPVGSGIALLTALGGAYLLGKRNKER